MYRWRLSGLLLGAALWTPSAAAQEQPVPIFEITYERALALAQREAPLLVAARARVREAESQIEAAAVFRFNPQLSAAAGPRFRAEGTRPQWSVGAQQWLEVGGQRDSRVRVARAGATARAARRDDVQRLLLRDVSLAFISALYWSRRVGLADENLQIAESIARVATRRHELGEVGGLARSISALAVVRARTFADQARASRAEVEGGLKALLGISAASNLVCVGDLRALGLADTRANRTAERPDLRALEADIQQTQAEASLGRSRRVPNLALGARYAQEESDDVVQGTLTLALPAFDRGQGTTRVAQARGERLRAERKATRNTAAVMTRTHQSQLDQLSAAARRFEREGLAALERAERLATASYQAGAVALGELLTARRELLQAKLDYTDLLLGAATARAELLASTGAHPESGLESAAEPSKERP